jgi:hypothetical protein
MGGIPDMSSISTCVASSFSTSVAFRDASVTEDDSAMAGIVLNSKICIE